MAETSADSAEYEALLTKCAWLEISPCTTSFSFEITQLYFLK